jgi:ADP-heptose:LPS heptosyltransferase
MKKVLLKFRHGLGDAVQLTIVLKHIKKQRPEWIVDVESLIGKHSCFYGLCNNSYRTKKDKLNYRQYHQTFDIWWHDPDRTLRFDCPATKVTKSLIEQFGLKPDPQLYTYTVPIPNEADSAAKAYLDNLPQKKGFVTIHYQGNTSSSNKNIPEDIIRNLARTIVASGYILIILDWDFRSNLPNTKTIFRPGKKDKIWNNTGTGDAGTIAAIIKRSALFIGIDSGPLHVAGATTTPSLGVWTKHHPIHYFDLAPNVKHLLPNSAHKFIRTNNEKEITDYFHANYYHRYYGDLQKVLVAETKSLLKIDSDVSPAQIDEQPIIMTNEWLGLNGKELIVIKSKEE